MAEYSKEEITCLMLLMIVVADVIARYIKHFQIICLKITNLQGEI